MLGRFALRCFHGLGGFRCQRSIALRSIHLAPSYCRKDETPTHPKEQPVPPPPAADPRWVMLMNSHFLCHSDTGADAKTVAESHTSTGRGFRVSVDLAPPPASSILRYSWVDGAYGDEDPPKLVAAHGDSVLFEIMRRRGVSYPYTYDYFVYRAGAADRPPSMSLLPAQDFSMDRHPIAQTLWQPTTGLLRRSDDELLVVMLDDGNESGAPQGMADLHVLRLGSSEWEKRWAVPIVLNNGARDEVLLNGRRLAQSDRVIPVGDRFLCWVKYSDGLLLCDMADDPNLKLRYLPLPMAPREKRRYVYESDDEDADDLMPYCRNMCAAGTSAVRFVSIDPRCCCGGPGRGTCPHSTFAFTVTTWTAILRTDQQMTWVKDGVLDCEELWSLPKYEGLPRAPLDCPVVSLDNPDIVWFKLSNRHHADYPDHKEWMLEVDTKRKALLSILQCPKDPCEHLPARFHYC